MCKNVLLPPRLHRILLYKFLICLQCECRRVLRCDSVNYLEGTIHHPNDVVKLLVVQYGTILLDVKTQFLSQTLTSCFAFQGTQCSWQSLLTER